MGIYRKLPIDIEAVQYFPHPQIGADFIMDGYRDGTLEDSKKDGANVLAVKTNQGWVTAVAGDWIIKGLDGELYPCSNEVFVATYLGQPETQSGTAVEAYVPVSAEFISTKRAGAGAYTKDGVAGMQITYQDGYVSWCPQAVFDRDYEPIDAMSFGHALYAIEHGAKVGRIGWNGKGMWICLGRGNKAQPAEGFWNAHTQEFALANGGFAEVLPYLIMKTADNKILMGWLASQTDMLAHDWQVIA